MHLLDTDILSLLQRGHPNVSHRVLATPANQIAITILSVEEQSGGWLALLRKTTKPDELAAVYDRWTKSMASLAQLPIRSFSRAAIERFESLRRLRLGVGSMDLRIAAVALEEGAVVVTRNGRDFRRIPGLVHEDWSK